MEFVHFVHFPFILSFLMLAVHAKSIVAILHLLVALSQHFRAPIRLPDHVSIQVVVVQVGVSSCSEARLYGSHRLPESLIFCRFESLRCFLWFTFWFFFLEKRGHPSVQTNPRRNNWQHRVSPLRSYPHLYTSQCQLQTFMLTAPSYFHQNVLFQTCFGLM